MPAQWFAVRSQGLDCQGGTGGEENLHDDGGFDGVGHDFRDGHNESDDDAGYDGGDGDDFADDYVDNSGGGDDTWVESGAQARA